MNALKNLSPPNQEYINFMGRVQGSKIRSQSIITAETQKKEKEISAKK